MYQLIFYVPVSHLEQVKDAVFDAGAGKVNGYDRCVWQTLGEGQFRSLAGSVPYQGRLNRLEVVAEYKVELVCDEQCVKSVVDALLSAHPYQQPAYAVYKILTVADLS